MNVKQHAFLTKKPFDFPSLFAQRCSNSIAICKFTLCLQMIDLAEKEGYSISREKKLPRDMDRIPMEDKDESDYK